MSEFQVGDTVWLKSGGPQMTVTGKSREQEGLECQWFDGTEAKSGVFPPEALTGENPNRLHFA